MRVAILQANLGNFDTPQDPVDQELPEGITEVKFRRWTDADFPPITGLTPRFQYRIPKMFGWQMEPGYDFYIWLDGTVSFKRPDCLRYYMKQLGNGDMAFFDHPNRHSIQAEVDHLDDYMNRRKGTKKGQEYLISRYANGLHKEQLADIKLDKEYVDDRLYASTSFIYKDSEEVRDALRMWFLHSARYWSCDQVALPYVTRDLVVKIMGEPIYKTGYMSLTSHHK